MAPVELGYSLNREPKEKVVAEDGVTAKLDTPAGTAHAKVEPQGKNWITRSPVIDRIGTKFPSDPERIPYSTHADGLHYNINSIFDGLIPNIRKLRKSTKLSREKKYRTSKGEVIIKATGYDQE